MDRILRTAVAVASLALVAFPAHAEIKLTVGGTAFPDTVGESHWLEFEERIEAEAGDEFDVRMLIYGQLGPEEQVVSGLRRNRVQFANLSALVTSTIVPEIALLYAPYLFDDEAEADYVFDTRLTPFFRELLAERGLHLVTWNEIGFHHVYGVEPIIVPDDAEGVRFRVSASKSAQLFAEALDADVIPLGYTEIVSALQTGLIEAGENGISLYARTGIASEAPHLTLTSHAFGMSVMVANKRWWDRLSPAHRALVEDAFPDIGRTRREIRAEGLRDLAQAEALGFEVHRLTPEQRELWREATRGTHEALIEAVGGRSRELYEMIIEAKAEYAERSSAAAGGS
jgi:TRAP-type C4-dicarboxylate transport system substrate-binding protein